MWEAPAKALPFHQQGMAKDSQGLIDPELPFPLGSHIISAPGGSGIIGCPFAGLEVAPNAQALPAGRKPPTGGPIITCRISFLLFFI